MEGGEATNGNKLGETLMERNSRSFNSPLRGHLAPPGELDESGFVHRSLIKGERSSCFPPKI